MLNKVDDMLMNRSISFSLSCVLCLIASLEAKGEVATKSGSIAPIQALRYWAKAQADSERMVVTDMVRVQYFKSPPTERESRNALTQLSDITTNLLAGNVEVHSIHSRKNGTQFSNQILRYSSKGVPTFTITESFDGRLRYLNITQHNILEGTTTGTGSIQEGVGGNLEGTILSQGKLRFIENVKVNGVETIHLESLIEVDDLTQKYNVWLAPSYSYQVVRKDVERSIPTGTEYVKFRSREEVTAFSKFKDTWLPKSTAFCAWVLNQQNKAYFHTLTLTELQKASSLKSTQKSVFATDFPAGTLVSEEDRDTGFLQGGDVSAYIGLVSEKKLPKELEDFIQRVVADNAAAGAKKPQ